MPERSWASATPEPEEPVLRAGTWQPSPRPRHARPGSDADDPLRLAPEELPWGIPARTAGQDSDELPPATVLVSRRGPSRVVVMAAAAMVVVVVLVVILAVLR